MKDFLIQSLRDLKALTGIRQVEFMQADLQNGKREFDLTVEGMLLKCKEFDYIPEAEQQRIIRDMMTKDSEYDGLTSRTLHKWFSMFAGKFYRSQNHFEEAKKNCPKCGGDGCDYCRPATPEEIERHLNEWKEILDKVVIQTSRGKTKANELREQLATLECKHPMESRVEISETETGCAECGAKFKKELK